MMQTTYLSVLLLCLNSSYFPQLANGSDVLKAQNRIVNGIDADIERFPYQLSLRRNAVHICGASVLSSVWAITAAHCIDGFDAVPRLFTLRMGSNMRSSGGTVLPLSTMFKHPSYNPVSMHCDVALLKTGATKLRGDFVSPIQLPKSNAAVPDNAVGIVSGWGHLSASLSGLSSVLKYTEVSTVKQSECSDDMKQHGAITNAMFCAAARRKDACQGDSGGPFQINGTLIGVVSWGVGCADPHYPGVYARLSYAPIRQWIKLLTKL